jgi:Zn-dependent alcohol dehydrogenase
MSNRAAFLDTPKGEFVVRDTEIPQPEKGEVLVRVSYGATSLLQSYTCGLWNKLYSR